MASKLRPKYQVQRIVPTEEEGVYENKGTAVLSTDPTSADSPFVLMPRKDPAAFVAMIAYARHCEPDLAGEIKAWLHTIIEAEPVYGTQGERNLRTNKFRALRDIL